MVTKAQDLKEGQYIDGKEIVIVTLWGEDDELHSVQVTFEDNSNEEFEPDDKVKSYYHGTDKHGNNGIFEDFEQSIGL